MNDAECKDAFRKFDKRGRGFVHKSKLSALLQQLSLPPTRTSMCEILSALDHEDEVSFEAFRRWYRKMLMPSRGSRMHPRAAASFGANLHHPEVGVPRPSAYDLPPGNKVYGKPAQTTNPTMTAGAALGYMGVRMAGGDSDGEEETEERGARAGQRGRGGRHGGRPPVGRRGRKKSAAELGVGNVLHAAGRHAERGSGGGDGAATDAGVEHLLATVKRKMKKRGVNGALGLRRFVRLADTDGDGEVDLQEFTAALNSLDMDLTARDARLLFERLDKDGSGSISFEEFQVAICGSLNDRRRMLVLKAFRKLDTDGSGVVDTTDIEVAFSANKHPAVVSGLQTADEVMQEFLATFEGSGDGAGDGMVTEQEFLDYYRGISMVIDEDDHFELLIRNAWQLPGGQGNAQFVQGGQGGGHDEMGALSKESNFMDAQLQLAKKRTKSLDQLRGPQRTVQLQLNKMSREYERRTQSEKMRYRAWAGLGPEHHDA